MHVRSIRIIGTEVFEAASLDPETGRTEITACATVVEEKFPYLPTGVVPLVLDTGL
jgi:hypothetical protein